MKYFIGMLLGVICALQPAAVAQQQNPSAKHLMKEDSAAVNALVMYPDTIRIDIFEACVYPAAIVSIASLQKNSSDEFVALIAGYSKDEQEDFWNLSRYPGLISRLAQQGKKSIDQIITILNDYPKDIHEDALKYGTKYYDLLLRMDNIQTQTNNQFEQLLADYPSVTQEALRELIQFPEIINLLNDHLSLTVRVGDQYKRNPQDVIHKADSLNLAETRKNAEDAEAWKQSIEQNPDEAQDLTNAANDYAQENGYTQDEVNTPPDPEYVATYTCSPYLYWFGYPRWYPYSYWYPYPFWFDCGFYRTRAGRIVIIGSPSHYFTNWYFYYPDHWRRYPNLCNTYINHYYGRRRTAGGNSGIVHNWVRDNRSYLPKDFIPNTRKRREAIIQVAQLTIDAQPQKRGLQVSSAVREDYFEKNKSKYPLLNNDLKTTTDDRPRATPGGTPQPERARTALIGKTDEEPATNPRQPSVPATSNPEVLSEPVRQPAVRILRPAQESVPDSRPSSSYSPDPQRPARLQPAQSASPDQEPVRGARQATSPPVYNFNKINRAQEYQRNIWEQTQPTARPQPQPAPPQIQQARPEPRPQVQTPPPPRPQPQAPAPAKRSKDD